MSLLFYLALGALATAVIFGLSDVRAAHPPPVCSAPSVARQPSPRLVPGYRSRFDFLPRNSIDGYGHGRESPTRLSSIR